MIAVLKPGASPERTQHLIHWLEEQNLGVHVSQGEYQTVLGLIGNTAKVDMEMIHHHAHLYAEAGRHAGSRI